MPSAAGPPLLVDVYEPHGDGARAPFPAVVIVPGYQDEGFQRILGCRHKEMAATESWARLIAASGMVAIAYANHSPAADLAALLGHLTASAATLGIDAARIGVWACSGNVPVALSALMPKAPVKPAGAALCYGYMMDLPGSSEVADAAKTFRFDNACAGRGIDELATDVPLLIVRAGRDAMPGLNAALDRFVAAALARNTCLSVINHAQGPHAFDLEDDSEATREVIGQVLAFLQRHLARPEERGRA
jgi:hypothetical protein